MTWREWFGILQLNVAWFAVAWSVTAILQAPVVDRVQGSMAPQSATTVTVVMGSTLSGASNDWAYVAMDTVDVVACFTVGALEVLIDGECIRPSEVVMGPPPRQVYERDEFVTNRWRLAPLSAYRDTSWIPDMTERP